MSDFLAEYGIKKEQIQEAGFKLPPVGRHNFVVGDAKVQKGTKNRPDETALVITYQLSNADGEPTGKAEDRYLMKVKGEVTPRCEESLGYAEERLKHLGFTGGFADPDFTGPDALVGIRGRLTIEHNNGKGSNADRKFANVRGVEVDGGGHEDDTDNVYADDVPETVEAPTKRQARGRKPKEAAENPAAENEDLWSED